MNTMLPIADDRPINFVENIWHYLSPFSAHQIEIEGEVFATVEHAYHCARYVHGPEYEEVKAARSPLECLRISRQYKANQAVLRSDFDKDVVMEQLFRAKLTQHPDVRDVLKLSGTRGLLKEIDFDYYWGTGADGSGENRMGKLWMKLRAELDGK